MNLETETLRAAAGNLDGVRICLLRATPWEGDADKRRGQIKAAACLQMAVAALNDAADALDGGELRPGPGFAEKLAAAMKAYGLEE